MNDETNSNTDTEKEKPMKTILIIGVSSFIGSNLAEFFRKDYKVVGTYKDNRLSIPGILTVPCDVLNKDEVQLVLFAFKPDITIYCAGMSSIYDCHKNDAMAEALNTSGLFNVAEYCQRYKSQICYLSSAFVFGGENKNYIEMDIPDTTTVYGKTQASAEFYIQKTSLNYVIFRCSRIYGRGLNPMHPTWFENLQRKIKFSQNVMSDHSVITGFLDVYYLAMVLKIAFDKNVMNRLFQVSSSDIMSFYDFAKEYCDVFGESKSLISKGKWPFPLMASATTVIEGDKKFKMDLANIEGFLNIELPTVRESIEFTHNRLNGNAAGSGKSKKGEGINFI